MYKLRRELYRLRGSLNKRENAEYYLISINEKHLGRSTQNTRHAFDSYCSFPILIIEKWPFCKSLCQFNKCACSNH